MYLSMRLRIFLAPSMSFVFKRLLMSPKNSFATTRKCFLTLRVTRAPLPPVRSPVRISSMAAIEASIGSASGATSGVTGAGVASGVSGFLILFVLSIQSRASFLVGKASKPSSSMLTSHVSLLGTSLNAARDSMYNSLPSLAFTL